MFSNIFTTISRYAQLYQPNQYSVFFDAPCKTNLKMMNIMEIAQFDSSTNIKTLLVVGPKPPPLGGATLNVQLLLDEIGKNRAIHTITINTSPRTYRKKTSFAKIETLCRAFTILRMYLKSVRTSDAVLLFTTYSFLSTLGCLLLLIARKYHVPFYVKPLGAELGIHLGSQNRLVRIFTLTLLRAATGVFPQTRKLETQLAELLCTNLYYVPGYRPAHFNTSPPKRSPGEFRLVFLAQIVREKGPMVLLEALRILEQEFKLRVDCDFYGPILDDDQTEFLTQIEATQGARYRGIAEPGTASQLMARYDALVFPTCFVSEGHPGVIIEAMQAGIPVISTQFPAVTELITDGQNGFLVPREDSRALASIIKLLALDPTLREKMGKSNFQRGRKFRSDFVVSQMIEIIFPGFSIRHPQAKSLPVFNCHSSRFIQEGISE